MHNLIPKYLNSCNLCFLATKILLPNTCVVPKGIYLYTLCRCLLDKVYPRSRLCNRNMLRRVLSINDRRLLEILMNNYPLTGPVRKSILYLKDLLNFVDKCYHTVKKNILLYQIDLTMQHRSNSARLYLGKGNIIFNEKLKTNHLLIQVHF